MKNKADIPHWNQFVSDVLRGRYKKRKEEAKQHTEDSKDKTATGKR